MHGEEGRTGAKPSLLRLLRKALGELLSRGGDLASSPGVLDGHRIRWNVAADSARRLVGEAARVEVELAQLPLVSGRELELARRVKELEDAARRVLAHDDLDPDVELDEQALENDLRNLRAVVGPAPADGAHAAVTS